MNYVYWQEVFENIQASSPGATAPIEICHFLVNFRLPRLTGPSGVGTNADSILGPTPSVDSAQGRNVSIEMNASVVL